VIITIIVQSTSHLLFILDLIRYDPVYICADAQLLIVVTAFALRRMLRTSERSKQSTSVSLSILYRLAGYTVIQVMYLVYVAVLVVSRWRWMLIGSLLFFKQDCLVDGLEKDRDVVAEADLHVVQ
jgi:hypothetical protein